MEIIKAVLIIIENIFLEHLVSNLNPKCITHKQAVKLNLISL